ncbi:hypothetical protein KC363_g101 [Hortaea werneckii]|nr:hypothetical protein KC363_g101 [Hortaea werneckii]
MDLLTVSDEPVSKSKRAKQVLRREIACFLLKGVPSLGVSITGRVMQSLGYSSGVVFAFESLNYRTKLKASASKYKYKSRRHDLVWGKRSFAPSTAKTYKIHLRTGGHYGKSEASKAFIQDDGP